MRNRSLAAAAALAFAPTLTFAGDCAPDWVLPIGTPGLGGYASSFAAWNDGSGEALYACGSFSTAGAGAASQIARWDGTSWSALSADVINSFANAVQVYNGNLYLGGAFSAVGSVPGTSNIARWDGSSWASLAGGITSDIPSVWSLAVYDGKLIVGGNYTAFGGVANTNYIAAWDGSSWSEIGGGINGVPGLANVLALAVYDGDLYAAGRFDSAGGNAVSQIAKWDGTSWSGVGGGITGSQVLGLTVHNDGSGEALYAVGNFTAAGGVPARGVAKWDGANWSALAPGFSGNCYKAVSYDDGSGADLYIVGTFTQNLDAVPMSKLARWDGSTWSDVGGGLIGGNAFGLGVWDDGDGESLYAGGSFLMAGPNNSARIAQWRGCSAVAACPADANDDNAVGSPDLAVLLAAWGTPGFDLNDDNNTNSADLAILLAAWGPCP